MYKNKKIAVVIPCYKVSAFINKVISTLPNFIDKIYVVDDACPEKSLHEIHSKSKKIKKIYRKRNGGVGAAVKDGYKNSLKDQNHITVRIDGDGQMDPKLIVKFINPIINRKAAFTKGNRFKNFDFLFQMPIARIFGNIFFSLIGIILIKNYHIFDFQNGFTCIDNKVLKNVLKKRLDNDFFFENSLIYNLSKMKIKILDINMKANYGKEKSNLNIFSTGFTILYKNILLFFKIKN
tara:strand:- start:51 stop:758 length:708 start_codon:yes stop_codon:yes gene_type:complete